MNDDPLSEPGPASRPGKMDAGDSVMAAIASGTGQPASPKPRGYRLTPGQRNLLLLLLAGGTLGYLASTAIHRRS